MKKLIIIAAMAAVTLGANAQLRVANSGQVRLGAGGTTPSGSGTVLNPNFGTANMADTLATVRILGSSLYDTGGSIAFGSRGDVKIAQTAFSSQSTAKSTALQITSNGGLGYIGDNGIVFSYYPGMMTVGAKTTPFIFNTTVSAPQYLTSSDARLKSNIEALDSLGAKLCDISPVSYVLTANETDGDENSGGPARSRSQSDTHRQFGFLAQDVAEVYPDLVYEDSEGMLSIDYTGFIAILVDAVQGMQAKVDEQAATIEALMNRLQQQGVGIEGMQGIVLKQNRPNPFRTSTVISCELPESVSDAFLCVYDLNGQQKLRFNLSERGTVDVTIDGNTLPAGMYIYTLVCDGQDIDTKRMILTD